MRQLKITIAGLGLASCFITLLLYYRHWHRSAQEHRLALPEPKSEYITFNSLDDEGTAMRHMPLDEIYKDIAEKKSLTPEDALDGMFQVNFVDTPGCKIPITIVNFLKNVNNNKTANCGRRAVFLKKTNADRVEVLIKINQIKKYLRRDIRFNCCYRFIKTSTEDRKNIEYTPCKKIENGDSIRLEADFVNVKCFETNKNKSILFYDDVYAFIKKMKSSKPSPSACKKERYNVLMLGMDSMSLARVIFTMPRTAKFFEDNFWFGYRGYHKVDDNTFPNLMAALTGKNLSTILKKCVKRMDKCKDWLIWTKFKEAGYVTAYGEDFLRLPDTFSKDYAFENFPADHYIKPLFLKGEIERNGTVCSGKVPAGQQLLDYAFDFAVTYRAESFFGLFWMNSFSHNLHSRSENADRIFENFFNKLYYTGIFDNTFLIFFSDHGIRFGEHRLKIESFYDERLPMLFMHVPLNFKTAQSNALKGLATNQHRLVTPYDLYNTLVEINQFSVCNEVQIPVSESCPLCHSMFYEASVNRTCQDVAINEKWCSCHQMFPLDIKDNEGVKSVMHMVQHIQSLAKSVETKRCWKCMDLSLKNIIRIHFYFDKIKSAMYHVVAFTMHPGNVSYEATVLRNGGKVELVGSLSVISPYKGLGRCAVNSRQRLYCVCTVDSKCHRSQSEEG